MPRLQIPDERPQQSDGINAQATAGAVASGARLGQLQAGPAAEAVANRAQLGEIQSSQGAAAMADAGQVGKIMMGPGAAAAAKYADIGKSAMHLGQEVMAQGSHYFQKAMASIDDAMYNNAYASASKEYNQRINERLNKPYGDDGQPTFSTLQADIDKIGADVYNKYGAQGGSRFQQSFSELTNNRSIMAMNEARKQQIQYSQGSLQNGLNAATTNALASPKEMISQYITEGNSQIDNAVKNGYITLEEGVQQKDKLRKNINVGWLQIQNQKDPVGTNKLLNSKEVEMFGINEMEKAELMEANGRQLNHLETQNRQRAAEGKALQTEIWNHNGLNLELGVEKGTVSENQIKEAYNKGDISHPWMVKLEKRRMAKTGETSQKTIEIAEVGKAVHDGDVLMGKFSGSRINDHYKYSQSLQGGKVPLWDPNAPLDKTRMATLYKGPVSDYTDEIHGTIISGSPQQVLEAVKSYQYVQSKNPLAASSLDNKTLAVIETVARQSKYTKEDLGPIIAQARKSIFELNPTQEEFLSKRFDNEEQFKEANIQETVKGMYGEAPWFGTNTKTVPGYVLPVIQNILKENYKTAGNAEDAISMTKKQTAGIIGASTINGSKATMFMPPEYAYPTLDGQSKTGMSFLRMNMINEVMPQLKDGDWAKQAGINPADLEVRSFQGTARQEGAEYVIYHKGMPLVYPDTGQQVTWKPDEDYVKQVRANEQQEVEQQQYQENLTVMGDRNNQGLIGKAVSYLTKDPLNIKTMPISGGFRDRSPGEVPTGIIVHDTGGGNLQSAISTLKQRGLAYHYLIDKDGSVYNLVPPDKEAYHALGYNKGTVGISLVGSEKEPANQKQNEALTKLSMELKSQYPNIDKISGHKHNSHSGKPDPHGVDFETLSRDTGLSAKGMAGNEVQIMSNQTPKKIPVGIRQHNPGNLVKTGNRWDGELPNATSRFKEFASPEDGIAAVFKLLKTKQMKGTSTPEELISGRLVGNKRVGGWSETDQAEYARNIAKALGIGVKDKYDINNPAQAIAIVKAIIKQENGYIPYSDEVIRIGMIRGS